MRQQKSICNGFRSNQKRALQGLSENLPANAQVQQGEKTSALADRTIILLKEIYDGKSAFSEVPSRHGIFAELHSKSIEDGFTGSIRIRGLLREIARVAGGSPRAVGGVMTSNPFAPIVPCHRIVAQTSPCTDMAEDWT